MYPLLSAVLSIYYYSKTLYKDHIHVYNASILVKDKVGYALCIDGIIKTGPGTDFAFRPLEPPLKVGLNLVWKKHQVFGKAAQIFLETLRKHLSGY